jgi:hypothetical protein
VAQPRSPARSTSLRTWRPTAALLIEIASPGAGEESWEKLPFYTAHDIDEALIVNPPYKAWSSHAYWNHSGIADACMNL